MCFLKCSAVAEAEAEQGRAAEDQSALGCRLREAEERAAAAAAAAERAAAAAAAAHEAAEQQLLEDCRAAAKWVTAYSCNPHMDSPLLCSCKLTRQRGGGHRAAQAAALGSQAGALAAARDELLAAERCVWSGTQTRSASLWCFV